MFFLNQGNKGRGKHGVQRPPEPQGAGEGGAGLTAAPGVPDKQPGAEWAWWGLQEV